jgi:hypothetical protein
MLLNLRLCADSTRTRFRQFSTTYRLRNHSKSVHQSKLRANDLRMSFLHLIRHDVAPPGTTYKTRLWPAPTSAFFNVLFAGEREPFQ